MAEYAAPMPVGGIEGVVRIDTSHVASDLAAVLKALQAVDDVLNSVSGGSSSRFADAFRQAASAGHESATASQAAASAADTYTVAATAGASAAEMFAQAMYGYTTAAVEGRSAAQMFADTVTASHSPMQGAQTQAEATAAALDSYARSSLKAAQAKSDFNAMMGQAPSQGFDVQFDKGASAAQRFATTVHDAHMDIIPFADANEDAALRGAKAWGQTRTVLRGMTDNEMTKADRGARELGEKMYHGANRGAGGAKEFNYQLMAMAYTLDDLQYVGEQGLRPILNNLIMIHPALGIAALGANTLYENWDKIAKLWGEGITLTEAEDMERLAKATEKTAQQERDLANYKEKRAKAEAAMRITSKAEDDQKKGVDAAIKAAGGGKAVVEKIAASMITPNADGLSNQVTGDSFRDYFTTKKEFEAEVEKWKKSANANPIERAIIERRIKDLKLKMSHLKNDNRKEVEFEASNLLGQATTDPNKLKQLQAIVPGFEGATPEAQARQKTQVEGLKKWAKKREEDERETQRWIADDQRKNQQLTDKTQREREKAGKDAIRLAEKSEKAEIKVEEDVAKAELRAIKEAEDAKDKIARDIDRAKIAMMSPARRRAFLRARAKALLAGQGELPPGGAGGVAGAAVGAGADAGIGGAPALPRMSARYRRTNRARLAAAAARRGAAAPIDLGLPGGDQAAPALNPDTNLNFKPPALNLEKPPELSAPLSDKEVKQMLGDIRDASNQTAGALATLVSDTTRDRG